MPTTAPQAATIAALRQQLAAPLRPGNVLPFGDSRIDAHLPGGGLPIGQLHAIGADGIEAQTGAIVGGFAAALAATLANHGAAAQARVVLWIAPRCDLYGPGLLPYGIDPGRLILVRTGDDTETLAAMETALRSGAAAVVLGEVGKLPRLAARRLHLACLTETSTGLLLRRWPHGRKPSPEGNDAATRWRLRPAPAASPNVLGPPCWEVDLLHARGGRPGRWLMQCRVNGKQTEDDDANNPTHPLRVVAVLGDDALAARPAQSRRAGG